MVIGKKYKYLFIETPRTGSTTLSKELRESYGGKEIVHKHANYHEFIKQASDKEKGYYVFAGVRNPLTESVSSYNKLLSNHLGMYTDPQYFLENGGWVSKKRREMFAFVQEHKSYKKYLEKYHRLPYTSNININKQHCNYIIRFENLADDFSHILKEIGAKQKRKLPHVNKTKKESSMDEIFADKATRDKAIQVFGPYMLEWGYESPDGWPELKVSSADQKKYEATKRLRALYSKTVKGGPLSKLTFIRNAIE